MYKFHKPLNPKNWLKKGAAVLTEKNGENESLEDMFKSLISSYKRSIKKLEDYVEALKEENRILTDKLLAMSAVCESLGLEPFPKDLKTTESV